MAPKPDLFTWGPEMARNPPTFGTSRQSRDVPLSRALAWPPSRIYLHGGREMAPKPDLFIWGPRDGPQPPPTFGTSRQSRDVPLAWPQTGSIYMGPRDGPKPPSVRSVPAKPGRFSITELQAERRR